MSECVNMVYWLEAVPSEVTEHLHKCPVPGCGHELILRKSNPDEAIQEIGAIAYRSVFNEEGETRRVVNVRIPGLCWCGAPLPQSERVVFITSDIEENRAEAIRILHQEQGIERDVAEVPA